MSESTSMISTLTVYPSRYVQRIAQVCHNANTALCHAYGDMDPTLWAYAPDWQRESALSGVLFHISNPGSAPSACHSEWMEHKHAQGWRFGHIKDADRKTHPCLVPFQDLEPFQQAKDYLFGSIVKTMLNQFDQHQASALASAQLPG